ncbi:hypothetical protein Pint_20889 [Pistacia integerrima]|uniref:Uncharacterized protein n=1 Tax=Pistacia integerrima TaxID=434235 RepID=A0ACC0XAG0_9ROSI|nr:hypothetical protein Pint_20889 [Pistacia integerrima]
MNQLSSIIRPPQQLGDITQQSRQNMITQTLSPGQVQQIQLQLLQRLQLQQQSLLAQQSALQQPAQLAQLQDQQRQLLDVSQSFSRSQLKLQQQQTGLLLEMPGHVAPLPAQISNRHSTAGGSVLTGAVGAEHSVITDDVPSCSTSPSANTSQNLIQPMANSRPNRSMAMAEDMAQSASTLLSTSGLETIASGINLVKDFQPKTDIKPSLNISKNQNQVRLSQNDVHIQQNNSFSYNPLRDTSQDGEVQADPRSNVPYGNMTFNPIDSTINDSSFMNRAHWAPSPQFPPRMWSYTKDGLKRDLARRFGIERQLEDRQRIGWKLVYVDHEHDVLLVGDDPWDLFIFTQFGLGFFKEFVRCGLCIKILSPQEVQQMSLDGDFRNYVLPHQACSSSDNGNA